MLMGTANVYINTLLCTLIRQKYMIANIIRLYNAGEWAFI